MPTEIAFSGGGSVKVMASVDEVAAALQDRGTVLDTSRFAGFRGEEAVGAERILVALGAVAYAQDVRGP
jgi:hypothetical protein